MRHFRFSIASLLLVVLFVAVGFAALRESSDLWESGIFSLALASLLTSILLTVHRTESRRAFWIGFTVFGWGYLGLSLVGSIEPRLMTTKALAYLDSKVPGRSPAFKLYATMNSGTGSNQVQNVTVSFDGNQPATSTQGQVKIWDATTGKLLGGWIGTTENFMRIGHSLFALLAGWFGGLLSRRLWQASRLPQESTTVDVEGTIP
jgi:hypothetical protein